MAKRKMGIRAAWLYLAKKWDKATPNKGCDIPRVSGFSGLCNSIPMEVDDEVFQEMNETIVRELLRKGKEEGDWLWPRTVDGAKSRAAFCRRQAAKYAPKKLKVKK